MSADMEKWFWSCDTILALRLQDNRELPRGLRETPPFPSWMGETGHSRRRIRDEEWGLGVIPDDSSQLWTTLTKDLCFFSLPLLPSLFTPASLFFLFFLLLMLAYSLLFTFQTWIPTWFPQALATPQNPIHSFWEVAQLRELFFNPLWALCCTWNLGTREEPQA